MSWRRFLRRRRWDDERAAELRAYLDLETDENIARGMTPDEARAAAFRKLGNPTLIREEIYQMNSIPMLEPLRQDVGYAVRLLRRSPAFTFVALLSLALGIGANTAIFRLLDAVRLRTLPIERPAELVEIYIGNAGNGRMGNFRSSYNNMTGPLWTGLAGRVTSYAGLFAWNGERFDLATRGESQFARGLWVSGDLFRTLGVAPVLGRLIDAGDDMRGCQDHVAVLSHAFWQREYGGRRDVLGNVITLDGFPLTIVGVVEPSFTGLDVGRRFDVALPLCVEPLVHAGFAGLDEPDVWWLTVMGRLAPGVSVEQADAELQSMSPGLFASTVPASYPSREADDYAGFTLSTRPAGRGVSDLREQVSAPLWMLLGTAGLLLLMACGNLANLMLARATAREREVAVRLAIGASRWRIARQCLTESLLIAAAGALAGGLLSQTLGRVLVSFLDTSTDALFLNLDAGWRVVAFAAALGTVTALAFGLWPALRATGTSPLAALRSGGRGFGDGSASQSTRRLLVVAQVALSVVLVAGALLFTSSFRNLLSEDPGFAVDGVTVASLDLRGAGVDGDALRALREEIRDALVSRPGIQAAEIVAVVPLSGSVWNETVLLDGEIQDGHPMANAVTPGFFDALDIPFREGRRFEATDGPGATPVAIVNERFVAQYLFDGPAIGRRFQLDVAPGDPSPTYTVVGVVGSSKYNSWRQTPPPTMFFPEAQDSDTTASVRMLIRSRLPQAAVAASVVGVTSRVSPSALVSFRSLADDASQSMDRERLMAMLSGLFAGLALLLAVIGLYGVMSYGVERRRTEIGLRMALGATRVGVQSLVLREAMRLLAFGLAVGATLAFVAGRWADTLLFGVSGTSLAPLTTAGVVLAVIGGAAAALPAWRAARLQPGDALRAD